MFCSSIHSFSIHRYINEDELIVVAQKTELKNTETAKAVEAISGTYLKTLSKGAEALLIGFGTFAVALMGRT